MACGIRPIVCGDSDKTTEYVRESGFGITVEPEANKTREAINYCINNPNDGQKGIDYIKNNWTEQHYAEALEAWIIK